MLQRFLRPASSALRAFRPAAAGLHTAAPAAPTTAAAPATISINSDAAAAAAAPKAVDQLRLLPLLRAQPRHYITVHIHKFPFLVTLGDTITLPFRLKGVAPGQTLRLTHASILGSRDYTLKGAPYIDENLYSCKAIVVEETSEPLRIKEKTKRRQRHIRKIKSKHPYTVLRIKELVVKDGTEE